MPALPRTYIPQQEHCKPRHDVGGERFCGGGQGSFGLCITAARPCMCWEGWFEGLGMRGERG